MTAALFLLLALQAQDPVNVTATLTRDEIEVGETAVLRVEVETTGVRPQIQHITTLPPGLELAGTRDSDQRQFSLPGGTRRFVSRDFVLRGRAAGRYRIPEIRVIVDGRTHTTRAMLLTVNPAAVQDRALPPAGPDGIRLRAWVGADTVYVGQQVTHYVEAIFSTEARLRLRRPPEYEPPSPSGFWVHDITQRRSPVTRSIQGRAYEVQSFQRAFFPISPGEYRIPGARLLYEMRRGILQPPESHMVESDPIDLVVLPVPSADRPPGFTGAVGRFEASGRLEPSRVPAGEAAVLTVEVEGTGNLKALPPPTLPTIANVDVHSPGEASETDIRGGRIVGTKRFDWVIVPREPGVTAIPDIEYVYFDPDARRFVTAIVPAMRLEVDPGALTVGDDAADTGIRYLKTRPGAGTSLGWVRSRWFAAAQALPLLLLAGALGVRGRRRPRDGPSLALLRRRRRSELRQLEALAAADDDGFFAAADALARGWVAERVGLRGTQVDRPGALESAGVSRETAAAHREVLGRLDGGRYAPDRPGAGWRKDATRSLRRVLELLDREAPAPGRGAGTGAAAGAALALALLAPAAALSGQEHAFADGLAAFDAGQPAEAAALFDRYVDGRPSDPAGWYNLGTAYHAAGYPGYAVWGWLHALRLDPRDADVRHNLAAAGAAPELIARVAPRLPLRTEELLLLASLAWLLAGAAGAWWVMGRRRAAAAGAVAGALLALVFLAVAGDVGRTAPTLVVIEATPLRAGPSIGTERLAALDPGAGVIPVARRPDWTRVRTFDGREGWVEADGVAEVARP